MIKKMSFSVVLLTSILLTNISCDDYLDVNKNVDAPDHVEGHLYLAGIIQQFQGMYWDIRATAPLTQMKGTTAATFTPYAMHYYPHGNDAGGEIWRVVYWLQGLNLENMINQSINNEEWTLAGIGYAIKAYSWDQMTKYHGELILRDAFAPGLLTHRYDYQKEIYPQVREWAYKAIEYLQKEDLNDYGTKISANDFIYGGDKDKWIRFAYGVIVRNLASLTNKSDFNTVYAQELIEAAQKSFRSPADDATVRIAGGGAAAAFPALNNFWGTSRANLSRTYFQHEYAVQVFTGTVPIYDEATGNKVPRAADPRNPFEPSARQIITDTRVHLTGHFDPRVAVKLATIDDPTYLHMEDISNIRNRRYFGGTSTSFTGPLGVAPSLYGRNSVSAVSGATHDGRGRWLYRDDAPYILMTYAEIQFCLAEAYWKLGRNADAFEAFKAGVRGDMEFTARYIFPGTRGQATGGDKITVATFNAAAAEYLAGPFVGGLNIADFSLSHIMMQKWVALYPWGALEAWVDMRKYHYDIKYSGDYPSGGNGFDPSSVTQKWDTDPTKVYHGFYLPPAQVQHRRMPFDPDNLGAPSYRIRPRFNSEYMWNLTSLGSLVPIAGTAGNYQTSMPWFVFPGEVPAAN